MSALSLIVLKKSFWGDERQFLAPEAFCARRRGTISFIQNRPRTFVAALNSDAAAEKSKNQLSQDFRVGSIFDFCNSISLKADIHHDDCDVSFVGSSVGRAAGNDGQGAGTCRTSLSCFQRLIMYFAMITRPTQMTAD